MQNSGIVRALRMRQLIRSVLEGFVSDIRECADGDEAFAAYAEYQPDWVLMDIKMTRLDGISATRQIMQEWPEAKVVMLTDYDDDELRAAPRSAGACDYVLKRICACCDGCCNVRRRILE